MEGMVKAKTYIKEFVFPNFKAMLRGIANFFKKIHSGITKGK